MFRSGSTPSHASSSTRYTSYALAFLAISGLTLGNIVPALAATASHGDSVTVMPGAVRIAKGQSVAVISATSTEGSEADAQRAIVAANAALLVTRGFQPVPTATVTTALRGLSSETLDTRDVAERRKITSKSTPFGEQDGKSDVRLPIDTLDLKALSKRLKNTQAMSVFITPGEVSDTRAAYSAVVELYDLKTGGVVGRGEGSFTSILDEAAAAASQNGTAPVANGVANTAVAKEEQLALRALGGAVYRAVQELNRPIELKGTVLSIPFAYQTRISLSDLKGLRSGARIEYLENGAPVAYGTVTSIGAGEALATVSPENAFSAVYVNMEVRNVSNPMKVRSGKNDDFLDDAAFRKFEREFGLGLAIIGVTYLLTKSDPVAAIVDPAT